MARADSGSRPSTSGYDEDNNASGDDYDYDYNSYPTMPSYSPQPTPPLPPPMIPPTDRPSPHHDLYRPGPEAGSEARFRTLPPLRPPYRASDRPIKRPPTELPPATLADNAYSGHRRLNARTISLASTSSSRSSVASSRSTTSSRASHMASQYNHASFGSATSIEEAVCSLFDFTETSEAIDELDADENEKVQQRIHSPHQQPKVHQYRSLQGSPVHRAQHMERSHSEPPQTEKLPSPGPRSPAGKQNYCDIVR